MEYIHLMKLLGLLGYPLAHSYSPQMINQAARQYNWECSYHPFAVPPAQLADFVAAAKLLRISGFNVTIPFKQAILTYCEEWTPAVREIGAANTIVPKDGKWTACNTDVHGFLAGLPRDLAANRQLTAAMILGAGGAARAAAYALAQIGCQQLFIASRSPERETAWRALPATFWGQSQAQFLPLRADILADLLPQLQLVVQATPVGTWPDMHETVDFPFECLSRDHFVYDLVYNPPQTEFLRRARLMNARIQNGVIMLAAQAAQALQLWGFTISEMELVQILQQLLP